MKGQKRTKFQMKGQKRTTPGIPTWSPTVILRVPNKLVLGVRFSSFTAPFSAPILILAMEVSGNGQLHMSPTADNVGKILPTGPVGDIDIFFVFCSRAKKCREMPTFHSYAPKYRTVEYIHFKTNNKKSTTQQPTRAAATLLPSAFPSSLSVDRAAAH